MNEEVERNILCDNCGKMNKFKSKGYYIKTINGMSIFVPTEFPKKLICEECGCEIV